MATTLERLRAIIAKRPPAWHVRIAMEHGAEAEGTDALVSQLRELLSSNSGAKAVTLVYVSVSGTGHFSALDRLSRLCAQQGVWSAVFKPSPENNYKKEIAVYVPHQSSITTIREVVDKIAQGLTVPICVREVTYNQVPAHVLEKLVASALMYCIEASGRSILGDMLQPTIPLDTDIFSTAVRTVDIQRIQWDQEEPTIKLACVPAIMKLQTIAEELESDSPDGPDAFVDEVYFEHVNSLPKFTGCRARTRTSIAPIVPDANLHNEEEYREYWKSVHGIRLPAQLGGYVEVQFSTLWMSYPACCVATEWSVLEEETRVEASDLVQEFAALVKGIFGGNVSVVSPPESVGVAQSDDAVSSNTKTVPLTMKANHDPPIDEQADRATKRRSIASDRYVDA